MEPAGQPLELSPRAVLHDVNNLLSAILGLATYIESLDAGDPEIRESAQAIQKAAETAAAIASRLLTSAPPSRQLVDLHALLRDLLVLLRPATPASIRLRLNLDATRATVTGDAAKLLQALLNLAINAREAMTGGGDLTIATSDRGAAEVAVTVEDTGRGIPREMQELVFRPGVTTKSDGHGSGLGLSTVRAIVEGHGGRIALDSEPGKGARFTVLLPHAYGAESERLNG